MDKKDFKELDAVGLRDYYSKLSRSEKGRFLRYLIGEMGLGYNSMVVKFIGCPVRCANFSSLF